MHHHHVGADVEPPQGTCHFGGAQHFPLAGGAGDSVHLEPRFFHGPTDVALGAIRHQLTAGLERPPHAVHHRDGPQFRLCRRGEGVEVHDVGPPLLQGRVHDSGVDSGEIHVTVDMTSCHDVLEHLLGRFGQRGMAQWRHVCPAQGLGLEASDDHLSVRGFGPNPGVQDVESGPKSHLQDVDGTLRLPCSSLVQPHRPKHVLRLRPRAMNAVVEHVHLRVVEGVASVFGLSQLHRAKVKILPSPPTQTAQNPAGPGPGDPSPSMTPSIPRPPASRWPCASTSRVCVPRCRCARPKGCAGPAA